MKCLIKASCATAALAAIFVVPSVASAGPTLTAPTGTVASGNIIATNVAHAGTLLTTKLLTGSGAIECETTTLTGELTKNAGGVVEGNITTAEFWGKPNRKPPHPAGQRCAGGFGGDTQVTPNHGNNPCHTPAAGGLHCSLPWCLKAEGNEDRFTVRGGKCNEAARALTLELHTTTIGTCSYEKPAAEPVVGTYTTHSADAVMTIVGQIFHRTTGSAFCPSQGELFMAFTLTKDEANGTEGAAAFIDKI